MSETGGEKSEAATARRLARAREDGHAPLSREAAPFATLAAGTLVLALVAPAGMRALAIRLAALLGGLHTLAPAAALRAALVAALLASAPFVLAAVAATLVAVLGQTGFLVNPGALRPDFTRLSPGRGLARLASPASLLEAGKAVLKLGAAGAAVWLVLAGALPMLPAALGWDPATLLDRTAREVLRVLLVIVGAQAAIAGFDITRARLAHARGLRMTRHEVREEHRESDGDPQIKARRRRLRMQRARKRMMQAVPKATVVVTNPTHYAVALVYQRGAATAPRVVAKGMDEVAARIREVARANGVPLVANPPLARALHAVELDAEIPREMFQTVAELIAYVWRLRTRAL